MAQFYTYSSPLIGQYTHLSVPKVSVANDPFPIMPYYRVNSSLDFQEIDHSSFWENIFLFCSYWSAQVSVRPY